ncbi:MAG: hypothetical protein WAN75_02290, partial [Xanthobacteraceae bacterium]
SVRQNGLLFGNTLNRQVGWSGVRWFVAVFVAISAAHRDVAPADIEAYWARATSSAGSNKTRKGPDRSNYRHPA